MDKNSSGMFEWIDAENTAIQKFCQIEHFSWGQRYFCENGSDHGKFNFIRLLADSIGKREFLEIVAAQEQYFKERDRSLHIKLPSCVFKERPAWLDGFVETGSPLVSILIRHELLPLPKNDDRISIVECKTQEDFEVFIEVNASGREWPLDHPVYEMMRDQFSRTADDRLSYILYMNGSPACTALALLFDDKYNLNFLATHKAFQRLGLMHYMNLWIAQKIERDFYVQVNDNEPSYVYYSKLAGAQIVNTEVKYIANA